MEFLDRVSAYPNRYVMTDENGNTSYIYLERADEPTVPGTPLNAETFEKMSGDILKQVLPLSGGTMTGPLRTGVQSINGVLMGGLYWDETGKVSITIPTKGDASSKWSMVICAVAPGSAYSAMYFASGQSAGVVDLEHKICGHEGMGIDLSIPSWGTIEAASSKWSHGWYIMNGMLADLNNK